MELSINNPEHSKQRAEVKPLTMEQERQLISLLNEMLKPVDGMKGEDKKFGEEFKSRLQRFIHNYENLRHFYHVVGGWDGLEKIHKDNCATIGEIVINNSIEKAQMQRKLSPGIKELMNGWISVSDRLPDVDTEVILARWEGNINKGLVKCLVSKSFDGNSIQYDLLEEEVSTSRGYDNDDAYIAFEPTHWRPLLEPPKTE